MLFKIDWPTNICIFPDLAIFPIDDGSELLLHFDAVFNTVYSGSAYSPVVMIYADNSARKAEIWVKHL